MKLAVSNRDGTAGQTIPFWCKFWCNSRVHVICLFESTTPDQLSRDGSFATYQRSERVPTEMQSYGRWSCPHDMGVVWSSDGALTPLGDEDSLQKPHHFRTVYGDALRPSPGRSVAIGGGLGCRGQWVGSSFRGVGSSCQYIVDESALGIREIKRWLATIERKIIDPWAGGGCDDHSGSEEVPKRMPIWRRGLYGASPPISTNTAVAGTCFWIRP